MSKKKISEERTIVERNGYKFETIWEEYIDVNDSPINETEQTINKKIKNKISTLNNKPSKISKINNKKIKIE